jgi:hypothetical protein
MAVELKLMRVEIERDAPKVGAQRGDKADVYVNITGLGTFEAHLQIFDFSSLDDAVEKARKAIYEFATELAKVADQQPMR